MRVAVFTMAYNEAVFLPMWIAHYARHFGRENVFVIDVGSTDESTLCLDANCIRLPRTHLDEEKRTAYVHHFHASLLSYYDVVIFCDTDEFLVADPQKYAGLLEFLKDRSEPVIAPIGLNLTQILGQEPAIDRQQPVLKQRRYAQFDSLYCRPIIGRRGIQWKPGFHSCIGPVSLNTNIYLFHLKAVDESLFISELRIKRKAGIDQASLAKGFGVQMSVEEKIFVDMHFNIDASMLNDSVNAEFNFQNDLERYVRNGFRGFGSSRGTVGVIPERFQTSLPALNGQIL